MGTLKLEPQRASGASISGFLFHRVPGNLSGGRENQRFPGEPVANQTPVESGATNSAGK